MIECQCINCGYTMSIPDTDHCVDHTCPKCGGQMRRLNRPGVGR